MKISVTASGTWDDSATLPITCPKCGHTTEEVISKLQQNKSCVCAGCGETIAITGDGLEQLEALKKAITNFGK